MGLSMGHGRDSRASSLRPGHRTANQFHGKTEPSWASSTSGGRCGPRRRPYRAWKRPAGGQLSGACLAVPQCRGERHRGDPTLPSRVRPPRSQLRGHQHLCERQRRQPQRRRAFIPVPVPLPELGQRCRSGDRPGDRLRQAHLLAREIATSIWAWCAAAPGPAAWGEVGPAWTTTAFARRADGKGEQVGDGADVLVHAQATQLGGVRRVEHEEPFWEPLRRLPPIRRRAALLAPPSVARRRADGQRGHRAAAPQRGGLARARGGALSLSRRRCPRQRHASSR